MRQIQTKEYIDMLKQMTEEGNEVSMLISGNSMSPFLIHGRDWILFRKPERKLHQGDMVFYQRKTGQYVMHRIVKKRPEGFYLAGDAQDQMEGPILEEQIFARIIKVKRKGKWIGPGNFWWEFFAHIWIHILPVRRWLIDGYTRKWK